MDVERVKCTECDAMILPQTAAKYGGMCAPCGATPKGLREEQREYERDLESGAVFTPSVQERESATIPTEFGEPGSVWHLEPEFYADYDSGSVVDVLSQAAQETVGNVFLVSESGGRLNLSFTEVYAVCEYQNEGTGDYLYAFTQRNLREQVPGDQHVVQACPCCGVSTLWFPSRFHMPRSAAFDIVFSIVSGNVPSEAEWLDSGDFSHTSRGKG